ncbi:hypothetical protein RFI_26797 [Reticulomyxa filosa]|uniref:Uncharacterized protein n=1 Tax=Reticulomyxa filosa TaxID=46433 RepID=X6MC02_RETFI|nr:hypothetical protein RFI_26797 [Reticulomyxa filosa]|eukprot:ETO10580.1 hypothetical protein RFI_26797 [Reticulomyxa filosa]
MLVTPKSRNAKKQTQSKLTKTKFVNIQRAKAQTQTMSRFGVEFAQTWRNGIFHSTHLLFSHYIQNSFCLIVLELQVESYESGDWILFTYVIQKLLTL